MKFSEFRLSSPALVAVFVAVAGIATFDSRSSKLAESVPTVTVSEIPAPSGEVPFIGELTVTASRD